VDPTFLSDAGVPSKPVSSSQRPDDILRIRDEDLCGIGSDVAASLRIHLIDEVLQL
jgi:hypothetical protein